MYASTSPTGESTSALAIKTLQDVAKACRKDSQKGRQLHEFSHGRIGPGEVLAYNSRLRSQDNIFFDPNATLTDKYGDEVKVRRLEFGAYNADRYGFQPCPRRQ